MVNITLEELKVLITAETSGLTKELNGVKKQLNGLTKASKTTSTQMSNAFKGLGTKLAKYLSVTAIVAGLYKISKAAVSAASDLEEVQNVVDVAFGSASEEINKFAENAITQFGITEYQAKKCASTFMAMSNGMGINADAGKKMSVQLTGLAADMASFYNVSQDVAETALKSVFTGETETLKKFGIVMTEANLEAYRLAEGITKSYSDMSQAEKVALRYNYVLKSTANAQNDYARTSGSWANQLRLLTNQWQQLMAVVGQGLTKLLLPIIKSLNNVLTHMIAIAKAIARVFGWTENTTVANDELNTSTATTAENLQNANVQAGKLKKLIAGFDELNVYSSKDESTSDLDLGSTSASIDLSGLDSYFDTVSDASSKIDELVEKYTEKVRKIKEVIETLKPAIYGVIAFIVSLKLLTTITKIIDAIKNAGSVITAIKTALAASGITTTILGVATVIGGLVMAVTAFVDMWKNGWSIVGEILKDLGIAIAAVGLVIAGVVTGPVAAIGAAIVAVVSTAAILIKDNWESITAWTKELWENIKQTWNDFKEGTVEFFTGIVDWVVETWTDFKEGIADITSKLTEKVSELWTTFKENISNLTENLKTNLTEKWETLKTNISTKTESLKETVSTKWESLKETLQTKTESIKESLSSKWQQIKDNTSTTVQSIKDTVSSKWETMKTTLAEKMSSIHTSMSTKWQNIKTTISTANENIGTAISEKWETIKTNLSTFGSNILENLVNTFTKMKDGIGDIFTDLKAVIKTPINAIIGFVNGLVSGVCSGINGMIRALNKLHFSVPDWVPVLGGKSFGFNLGTITAPSIPYLAKGGVIEEPTLAMVGEKGREIVTPDKLLTNIVNTSNEELASVYMQVGRQIISAIENQNLSVSIGNDVIASAAAKGNREYYKRTGRQLIGV